MRKTRAVALTALVAASALVLGACSSTPSQTPATTVATTGGGAATTSAASDTSGSTGSGGSSAATSAPESSSSAAPETSGTIPEGEGSTVKVAWNQAFFSYNQATSNGNATANANIVYLMNSQIVYYDADQKLQHNDKFAKVEKLSDSPLTVKYTIAEGVKWSDGVPVDATDLMLAWAAGSGKYNDKTGKAPTYDPDTGELTDPGSGLFFDGVNPTLALITDVPKISDDGRGFTVVYPKPFVDWELNFGITTIGVPAHVVGEIALNETDGVKAKADVLKAIQSGDKATLSKIAATWNTKFDFKDMPKDPRLYVGNGPYVLADAKKEEYVILKKNPNFTWGNIPSVDQIIIRFIGDPTAQAQALENGEVDLISPQATADILEQVQGMQGVTVDSGDESTYEHVDLTFDNKGPFDPATYGGDKAKAKAVREAFLKLLPRQDIIDKLIKPLNPDATLRNSLIRSKGSPGYDEIVAANGSAAYATVDIDGAKALLAQAGVKTPVKVKFLTDSKNTRRQNELQLITEAVAKGGFEIVNNSNENWGSKLGDKTYDVALFGWQSTSTGVVESSANFQTGGLNNLNGYSNPEVDKLFDQLNAEFDTTKQFQLMTSIEKLMWADAYGVTIFQFPGVTAFSEKLTGVKKGPLAPTIFWNYWDWKIA